MRITLYVLIAAFLIGCLSATPKVTRYNYAKPNTSSKPIIVHYFTPDTTFEELGMVSCDDTNDQHNLTQLRIAARKMGADAIIILQGKKSMDVPIGGVWFTQEYGMKAIAIRYK